ncbi:type IV pilus twitching motility protein PilT [Jeotgalibaca sp. A127]|uniref:type IV pilus twitching motility protein PilT n=1 Tax=Jeotgalibaca sp. A127 TaxID=3457324 RepID=UPI003FD2D136
MEKLNKLLTEAFYANASDVHLVAGSVPIFRIDGKLLPQPGSVLTYQDTKMFTETLLAEEMLLKLETKRDIDFSYGINGVARFRVNVFYQRNSLSLAFRVISTEIPGVETLGIPSITKKLMEQSQGLFLVTGPTGSGKTTSLAALINYMNQTQNRHIITLEDPIEYLHAHNKSLIVQREIGFDATSFQQGLRASLRQNPDVILVGELRDLETIATAITAAETGHLVLGTLHTADTTNSIERMIDVFPGNQRNQVRLMLANVLIAIMSQHLLPTKEGRGRVVATELLINNPAIKNLIRNEKMHQIPNVLQTSSDQGMHTMAMSMNQLLKEGKISRNQM